MKKETVNTFLKGMIKDLHPLTTPNDVITDALNATFITYNGNESILQNDMGNTKVGTAYLPKGYVPVGMKEHGGIVYVAAYNPETNKGQIGSFPSPLLLWEGDDRWTVNALPELTINPSINTNDFYDNDSITIKLEVIKLELFTCTNGQTREFHPGDKFAITCSNLSTIQNYINLGYITVQLAVVRSDGSIEIMKTMERESDENFFLSGTTASIGSNCQVFNASSSGKLLLIVTINTLDSFNLLREYKLNSQNKIEVRFTGEATIGNEIIKTTDTITDNRKSVKLYDTVNGQSTSDNSVITKVEPGSGNNSVSYEITPHLPYGVIKRMKRTGKIDFNKIRKNELDFHEWRFFVTDAYIKLGWAYEFYNLEGDKEIEYIQMDFYEYTDSPETALPKDTIYLYKDYYSGNFEDYIRFDEHPAILKKHIYIVKVSQKLTNSNLVPITYKMLYVSKLYNSSYNELVSNDNPSLEIIQFTRKSVPSAQLLITSSAKIDFDDQKYKLKTPKEHNNYQSGEKSFLKNSDYMTLESEIADPGSVEKPQYITKVTNSYKGSIKFEAKIDYDSDDIIGVPDSSIITNVLNNISLNSSLPLTITRELEWEASTTFSGMDDNDIPDFNNNPYTYNISSISSSVVNNEKTISNILLTDTRYLLGEASSTKNAPYKSVGFSPVYQKSMSYEDKNRVAPFWDSQNIRVISGCDNKGFYYNSFLTGDGSIMNGSDAGAGRDDKGLDACNRKMGNTYPPTVNIFAAQGGDHASLAVVADNYYRRLTVGGWNCNTRDTGPEIDASDNYLIACWKFTDGVSRFTGLMTPRTWWPASNTSEFPRLDIMLRAILSLLFISKETTKTVNYITTDENYYRYQEGTTSVKFKFNNLGNYASNDIMKTYITGSNYSLNYYYTAWEAKAKLDLGVNDTVIQNLIPQVGITIPQIPDIDVLLEDSFNMSHLTGYYLGFEYQVSDDYTDNIGVIKTVDVNKRSQLASYCQGGVLKSLLDGTFEWTGDLPEELLTTISGDATLLRWDNPTNLNLVIKNFGGHFTTRAAYEGWNSFDDNSYNEILAVDNKSARGVWTKRANESAPDFFLRVLCVPSYFIFYNNYNSLLFPQGMNE